MENSEVGSFLVNLNNLAEIKKDIELRVCAMEEAIEAYTKKGDINGMPLIRHFMQFISDPEDLKRLAWALGMIAPLLPQLDELKKHQAAIDLATNEPGWFAATFGDYNQDVETLMQDLQSDD